MIWYIIHNIFKVFSLNMDLQSRNLFTFLTGVVLYTLLYSYIESVEKENSYLNIICKYSTYILITDVIMMVISYKNTIFKKVEENMIDSKKKQKATSVECVTREEEQIDKNKNKIRKNNAVLNDLVKEFFPKPVKQIEKERLPELMNESSYNEEDLMEGFTKDSALGGIFSTNGKSNN